MKKGPQMYLVTQVLCFIIIEPICRATLSSFHNLPEKSKDLAPLVALHECGICIFGIDSRPQTAQ
jgi:hypothetical protein